MNDLNDKAVAITNLTWDANASKQHVEQAAKTVTAAIEKNTDKITATIKDGTKAISEATRKATTNESSNSRTSPVAASVVAAGLSGIAESTAQTAHYLRSNPTELKRTAETMEGIGRQFTDLTACATQSAENNERLWGVVGETKKTVEWIGSNFANGGNVPISNSFGRVVGSFGDLFSG